MEFIFLRLRHLDLLTAAEEVLVVVVVMAAQELIPVVQEDLGGILYYHHPHMELQDHLHQPRNIDTLQVAVVDLQVAVLRLIPLVPLVALVVVVLVHQLPAVELQELRIPAVAVAEQQMGSAHLVVRVSSLFNIQSKR